LNSSSIYKPISPFRFLPIILSSRLHRLHRLNVILWLWRAFSKSSNRLRLLPNTLQIVLPSTAMDCFGDFCLACDKQTNGTPFCSQACRLAELDHSLSTSEPASPIYTREQSSQTSSVGPVTTGFHLPPAIDFLSYRRERTLQTSMAQGKPSAAASSSAHGHSTTTPRSSNLTPSSSQTSLSSLRTNQSSPGGISEQAWTELRNYASGFDQVRALKRRMSTL
jgi:ECL1/2/3 zinc binding proteins